MESSLFTSLNGLHICILIVIIVLLFYKWLRSSKNIPPGPYGLPFVGYVPFIGNDPSKTFTELGKKYGNIISVKVGTNLLIVVNDYGALKEVYGNPNSLDRPIDTFDFFVTLGFGTKNGQAWQEQRRASIQIMRDLGIGKSQWEGLVKEEAKTFVETLEQQGGKPFNCDRELRRCVINNVIALLIGRNLKNEENDLVARYLDIALTEGSPTGLLGQSNLLRKIMEYLPFTDVHQKSNLVMKLLNFLKNEIHRHKTEAEYGHRDDFMNLYFEKMKAIGTKDNDFSEYSLLGNVHVLIIGAADTTHITLTWLFRLMAHYPDIQRRVQQELDGVIGQNETVSLDDREKLIYTSAVIMETLRYTSIEAMSAARSAITDFKVGEYHIPKGSHITANLKAINHDPRYWERPDEFLPERFLRDGGNKVEYNPASFSPFSYGRRRCPGDKIFWMEAMIIFTMVCHRFTIRPAPEEDIHFDTRPGMVFGLKPQKLCFIKRDSVLQVF